MTEQSRDAGFILLDALVAVALLGIAGTVIITVEAGLLHQQKVALDRSVGLTMSQSLMRMAMLLPPDELNELGQQDELYIYAVQSARKNQVASVTPMEVVATPRAGADGGAQQLAFLYSSSADIWVP